MRHRGSSSKTKPSAGSVPTPIPVNSSSPKYGSPPLSSDFAPPAKPRVLKVNIFGEASSESDGSVSMTGSPRYAENAVIPPAEYDRLAPTRLPRAEWFTGYRDQVPWSHPYVHPWSSRRLSMTSVAELDVDTLFKQLTRSAGYIFPAPTAPRSKSAPPESEWTTRLVTSAQVLALYQQMPWNQYPSQVTPFSFHETGWFAELASAYRDFETRHRQDLWEATHAIYLPAEQRDRDRKLAWIYQQCKQRRSRCRPRWKTVLRFILRGMIHGHCDLDLFLDSFFMHLPSPVEMRPWYPGLGDSPKKHSQPDLRVGEFGYS